MHGCMHGWMGGWADGWKEGRMDGWMDGWMDAHDVLAALVTFALVLVGSQPLHVLSHLPGRREHKPSAKIR